MGDLTKNFSKSEFECPCCKVSTIDGGLVHSLQRIRDTLGRSMAITSGYRCEAHNKAVGGVETSAHRLGLAVDIACKTSTDRARLLPLLVKEFRRIGIGKDFIHVDIDMSKPNPVIWDYYGTH